MSIRVVIATEDHATLPLQAVIRAVEDKPTLHRLIGASVGTLVKRYIIEEATPTRHVTAQRLGASPTNYLAKAGASVVSRGDSSGAEVVIPQNGEIFARVGGPVTVRPRLKKYLTLPATAAAYSKRAGEMEGLQFRINKAGTAMLVMGPRYQRKPDGTRRTKDEAADYRAELKADTKVMYWLKKRVTLSEDRGLLPSDAQFYEAIKDGAAEALTQQD